ncbi:TolB-like translocation protein [Alloprevotella tannerae]|uniref:WD40-like protein n=1 Tax=Alloprevotella tannerae ATCC 51259 TaxID=626522 RepID=C9LDK3_9BACT|nr:hypothetical protein [Alloprevotella tannerae]EEX72757.1 hypothetical protein GCWU000325_00274 [Alloprevotella tannerae ATCC 51259]
MYARYLAFLLPLLMLSQTAEAQRRTGEKDRPASKVAEKNVDAETLIRTYRFDEAISSLQHQIATAKRQKKTTIQLEQALSRARLGAIMLSATEKVRIIDSLVVDRGSIPIPQLRKGLGKLQAAQTLAVALGLTAKRVGEAAYINDWGDRAYFAMADTTENLRLYVANRFGQKWGEPSLLPGFALQERNEDFPFMDPDGVTLYFAADGAESLGGYDLFQTRYDADAKAFLKPQNLGMPFNSPANDFLMVIDRANNMGWFVSDRYQPVDKLCIYSFIPNDNREVYDASTPKNTLRQLAMLMPLELSQISPEERRQLAADYAKNKQESKREDKSNVFIINDNTVYHSLDEFRHTEARKAAKEWWDASQRLQAVGEQLDELRRVYAKQKTGGEEILRLEQEQAALQAKASAAAVRMRALELK